VSITLDDLYLWGHMGWISAAYRSRGVKSMTVPEILQCDDVPADRRIALACDYRTGPWMPEPIWERWRYILADRAVRRMTPSDWSHRWLSGEDRTERSASAERYRLWPPHDQLGNAGSEIMRDAWAAKTAALAAGGKHRNWATASAAGSCAIFGHNPEEEDQQVSDLLSVFEAGRQLVLL